MKLFREWTPGKIGVLACGLAGILAGLGIYTIYMSRAWSYASSDPAVCVNCHIMAPYYQSWRHSSHGQWATCNDCHVPGDNVVAAYAFKAVDGLYHSAVFTVGAEPQVIRPREASYGVIMDNCIRCHTPLVTEFAKMEISYPAAKAGAGKPCWECHTQVPHTNISNIASSTAVAAPVPGNPVPDWMDGAKTR